MREWRSNADATYRAANRMAGHRIRGTLLFLRRDVRHIIPGEIIKASQWFIGVLSESRRGSR